LVVTSTQSHPLRITRPHQLCWDDGRDGEVGAVVYIMLSSGRVYPRYEFLIFAMMCLV